MINRHQTASGAAASIEIGLYAILAVYIVALSLWLCLSDVPWLQDFVDWIYQGYLTSQTLKSDPIIASRFHVFMHPVPNSAAQVVMGVIGLAVGPILAARLMLAAYLIAGLCIAFETARRLSSWERPALLILFLFLFVINGSFWSGYINYQVALLLLAAYIVFWLKGKSPPIYVVVPFSIAIFFSHFAVYAAFVALYSISSIARRSFRSTREILAALWGFLSSAEVLALSPSLLLATWYMASRLLGPVISVTPVPDKVVPSTISQFAAYKFYTLAKLGPFQAFELPQGGMLVPQSVAVYWTGVALNVGVALALLLYAGRLVLPRSQSADPSGAPPTGALVTSGLLAAAFVIMPQFVGGVVNIGERFLIAAVLLLFIYAPPRKAMLAFLTAACLTTLPLYFIFFTHPGLVEPEAGAGWVGRYFSHRPYQFSETAAFLRDPKPEAAPDLSFRTGFFYQTIDR